MQRLIRTFGLLVVLVASLATVHAGGAGTALSPFAGEWAGTWINSNGVSGTFEGSISPSGVILMDSFVDGVGSNGTVRGHVNRSGKMSGVLLDPPAHASPFSGTMTLDESGNIIGDWIFIGSDVTGVFELFPQ